MDFIPLDRGTEAVQVEPGFEEHQAHPARKTRKPKTDREFHLTVCTHYRDGEVYPNICFGGDYLDKFDFGIGTKLIVTVDKDAITIKRDPVQTWRLQESAVQQQYKRQTKIKAENKIK